MSTEVLRLRIIERPDSFIVEKYAVTRVMVPKERPPKWLRDRGFDAMIRSIHGGCYAREEDDGEWYPVDLEAKEVIYTARLEEDENRRNFLLNHPHIVIYLISSLASDVDEAKSWLYPTGQLPVEYVDATHRETLNTCQPDTIKTSLHGCEKETLNTRQPAAPKILLHGVEEKEVERVRETLNMIQAGPLKTLSSEVGK